jgi:tetratricopeptide (TPR) repeat protein
MEGSQRINAYVNLSAVAIGQGLAPDAIKWAEEALSLSLKLEDRLGSAWAYFYLGYACLLDDRLDAALQSFSKCIETRLKISVPVLVAEARAGLLDVYLKMGNADLAQMELEQVIGYMDLDQTFQGAEEPSRVLWTAYQALEEMKDPRAATVLQNAIQLLNTQVSKLRSEDARRMYVEDVPWRRAIQQTAKKLGLSD